MNKYQKRKSREIKALVRRDKFGRITYKQARSIWRWIKRCQWCSPCEGCDNWQCREIKKPIAYCPGRR